MEHLEQIKDGVKHKLIEFMAEQITKEESFANLKSELIEEFFSKKEIKTPVVNKTSENLSDTFGFVAAGAQTALEKIKEKQAERFKQIIDIKLGRNANENIINKIKQLQKGENEKPFSSYSDVIELLENKKPVIYSDGFTDSRLKTDITEKRKVELRESYLNTIKEIFSRPASEYLNKFEIKSAFDENYLIKNYTIEDKEEGFKFECSSIYSRRTKQYLISKLYVDCKGLIIMNEELGIPFAIEAMNLIDQQQVIKDEVMGFIDKKTARKPVKSVAKKPASKSNKK